LAVLTPQLKDSLNATIGPLYALQLFMDKHGSRIISSKTENHRFVWKQYNDW
jgi:hypothetical protein